MEYSEMRRLVDGSVEFPITHEDLVEQLGDVELTAPTGDSVPVGEILDRAGEPEYQSTDMVYATIIGNLGDIFIGHKYADGRGGARTCPDPKSATRRSF